MWLLPLWFLLPQLLHAHAVSLQKAEVLTVTPKGLTLDIRYEVAAGDGAQELRALHDRDRDGRLDKTEQAALTRYLTLLSTAFLRIQVNDKPLVLPPARCEAAPLTDPVRSSRSISTRCTLDAPFSKAQPLLRSLQVDDRIKDARSPVAVTVLLTGGLQIDRAWLEEKGAPPAPILLQSGVLPMVQLEGRRRLHMTVQSVQAPQGSSKSRK